MRLLSKLGAGVLGLTLTAGLITATGPTVTAGAAPLPAARPGPSSLTVATRALHHLLARMPATNPGCSGSAKENSSDWAGYAICPSSSAKAIGGGRAGGTHRVRPLSCPPSICPTEVSGDSSVPHTVRCEGCGDDVAWVIGLDGFSDDTMESVGFGASMVPGSASATYYTWWEMDPSEMKVVGTTVRPGDQISMSVRRNGTEYILSLTDSTTPGNSFSVTQSCPSCADSSAEWITLGQPGIWPPDFGAWNVTGATASVGSGVMGITGFPYVQLTMVNSSGDPEVRPGPLDPAGAGFSDTWVP